MLQLLERAAGKVTRATLFTARIGLAESAEILRTLYNTLIFCSYRTRQEGGAFALF